MLNFLPKDPVKLLAEVWLPLGTVDDVYTDCYLTVQKVEGQNGDFYKPCDDPPVLLRQFEQLDGLNETMVGDPSFSQDQYNNTIAEINWVQLSLGTAVYSTIGSSTVSTPDGLAVLKTEEHTDNGTLRSIKRVYTTGGSLADNEELKFGGKLKVRTLKYLNEIPPTPAGYTLITQSTEYVRGLPLYNYGFASASPSGGGGGVISTDIVYHQSSDQGATGVTVQTIRYVSDLSVVTNPITTPAGYVLISIDYEDENGFRMWTGVYAKGTGEVSREISYGQTITPGTTGTIVTKIVHLTASTVTSNPTTGPAGSILVELDHKEADGYRIWTVAYGQGTGTVSEGDHGREDGSIEYAKITLSATAETPSAPIGLIAGTSVFLVALNNAPKDGYFLNTATFVKPPVNRSAEKRTVKFTVPGLATAANPPTFDPPITRAVLATVFETWGLVPNPDSLFAYSVISYAQLEEEYEVAETAAQVSNIVALDGYVGSSSLVGSNTDYRGIDVTAFAVAVGGSDPTVQPSGLTILDVDTEPYLTDIYGVIVWKTTVLKFTF